MSTIVIWKSRVLYASETFIRNQVDAMSAYQGVLTGAVKVVSAVARDTDHIIFAPSFVDQVRRRVFLRLGRGAKARRRLAALSPVLVHAHFVTEATVIARSARALGIPLVTTAHGRDVTASLCGRRPKTVLRRYRLRRALRASDRVIAVSEFIRDRVVELGAENSSVVVHRIGIPVPSMIESTKRWDVVFVGRLVEKKGVIDLLSALEMIGDRRVRAAVIGDGVLRQDLEDRASGIAGAVEFLGSLPPERVAEELAAARIFVGPSRRGPDGDSEGFGMVFLEAAAAGVPAVAYRHGGVAEAVLDGVTGFLAEEGDVAGLAERIRVLLDDESGRVAMGVAARTRVEQDFEIGRQTRLLEEIYREVLADRAATPGPADRRWSGRRRHRPRTGCNG